MIQNPYINPTTRSNLLYRMSHNYFFRSVLLALFGLIDWFSLLALFVVMSVNGMNFYEHGSSREVVSKQEAKVLRASSSSFFPLSGTQYTYEKTPRAKKLATTTIPNTTQHTMTISTLEIEEG